MRFYHCNIGGKGDKDETLKKENSIMLENNNFYLTYNNYNNPNITVKPLFEGIAIGDILLLAYGKVYIAFGKVNLKYQYINNKYEIGVLNWNIGCNVDYVGVSNNMEQSIYFQDNILKVKMLKYSFAIERIGKMSPECELYKEILAEKERHDSLEEIVDYSDESYYEGGEKNCIAIDRIRNKAARDKCAELYNYVCQVCGLKFSDFYGEIGEGFIHVHHLNPISAINGEYSINPEKDLVAVCPNCHVMLHQKRKTNDPRTIEELKNLIKEEQCKKKG